MTKINLKKRLVLFLTVVVFGLLGTVSAFGADLSEIRKSGVLRHLGVPYAHFVTGSGDGMDVELVSLFAQRLGLKYVYVETSWKTVIGDLTGKRVTPKGKDVAVTGHVSIKGDIIANGLTRIPWREKVVAYSTPTFPTQVWLLARADAPIKPITPSGDLQKDIAAVKATLHGRSVLGKVGTCLQPSLYGLKEAGAKVRLFNGKLNELAPAVINGEAETTILDVPDALIALEKWPGKIKVIGPISEPQVMGVGFRPDAPKLLAAFNRFLETCRKNGTYLRLVKKYYPNVFLYYPDFFKP